jgi:alpha-amylase
MNYMNVLSDFIERVNSMFPVGVDNDELNSLLQTIEAQSKMIAELEARKEKKKSSSKTAKA